MTHVYSPVQPSGFGLIQRDLVVRTPETAAQKPGEFTDGPMLDIKDGVFQIPANREIAVLAIPYALATSSPVYQAKVQWALSEVGRLSKKLVTNGGAQFAQARTIDDGQWWGTGVNYDFLPDFGQRPSRVWKKLAIGPQQVWWFKFVNGEQPIAKFTHPTFNKSYGIFLKIDGGLFTFTFKPYTSSSVFSTLLGWLSDLVVIFVKSAMELWDKLKQFACPIARQQIDKLALYAAGHIGLSDPVIQSLTSKGVVSEQKLDMLRTNATQALATSVGNSVIDSFCGTLPTANTTKALTTTPKMSAGKTAVIVGAAALGLGGLYLLARKWW